MPIPCFERTQRGREDRLVLGCDFVWSDLLCYTAGVWATASLDLLLVRSRKSPPAISA
jgi:hypothetical protein